MEYIHRRHFAYGISNARCLWHKPSGELTVRTDNSPTLKKTVFQDNSNRVIDFEQIVAMSMSDRISSSQFIPDNIHRHHAHALVEMALFANLGHETV